MPRTDVFPRIGHLSSLLFPTCLLFSMFALPPGPRFLKGDGQTGVLTLVHVCTKNAMRQDAVAVQQTKTCGPPGFSHTLFFIIFWSPGTYSIESGPKCLSISTYGCSKPSNMSRRMTVKPPEANFTCLTSKILQMLVF